MCSMYGVDPQFYHDDDGGGDDVHSRVPNFLLGEDVRERIRRDPDHFQAYVKSVSEMYGVDLPTAERAVHAACV
jgi:hypothetical protein